MTLKQWIHIRTKNGTWGKITSHLLCALAILLTECLCTAYRVHNLGDFCQVHIPNFCGLENETVKPMQIKLI
jgi:hypothetical protein